MYLEAPDGAKVLVCNDDGEFFMACMPYLSPTEFCERYHADPNFRDKVDTGRQNFKAKGGVNFTQEAVRIDVQYEMGISRRYTIINDAEWRRAFNEEPRAKKTRYSPSVDLQTETGELEKVYLFEYDPASPFRFLTVTRRSSCSRGSPVMAAKQHLYEEQARDLHDHQASQLFEEVTKSLDGRRPPSLLQKQERLQAPGKNDDVAPVPGAPSPLLRLSSARLAAWDAAEQGDESQPATGSVDASPMKAQDLSDEIPVVATFCKGASSTSLPASASVAGDVAVRPTQTVRANSVVGWGRASAAGDEAASVGPSLRPSKGATKPAGEGGPLDLEGWMARLDIEEAMLGKGSRLNVHHAEAAVRRWSVHESAARKNDSKRLKQHLSLHALAESIAPEKMCHLDRSEIKGVMELLMEKGARIPPAVLVAAACRNLDDSAAKVQDDGTVNKFLEVSWPWAPPGGEKPSYDLSDPKVSALDEQVDRRIEIFAEKTINDHLVQFVEKHTQDDSSRLVAIVAKLKELCDNEIDREDELGAVESKALCELQAVCLGLASLIDPSQILLSKKPVRAVSCVGDMRQDSLTGSPSLFSYNVGLACRENPVLNASVNLIEKKKAAILELSPQVTNYNTSLANIGELSTMEKCSTLKGVILGLPRIITALGDALTRGFAGRVEGELHQLSKDLLGNADAQENGLYAMAALVGLLTAAATVFTQDTQLLEWKQQAIAHHNRLSKAAKVDTFVDMMKNFKEKGGIGEDVSNFELALSELSGGALPDSTTALLSACAEFLVREFMAKYPEDTLKNNLTVAKTVGELLEKGKHPKVLSLVEPLMLCMAMVEEHQMFKDHSGPGSGQPCKGKATGDQTRLEALLVAQRRAADASSQAAFENDGDRENFEKFQHEVNKCFDFIQQIGQEHLDAAMATVSATLDQMTSLQYGMKDGKDWTSDLPAAAKTDFKQYLEHAAGTILRTDEVASLKGMVEKLDKARSIIHRAVCFIKYTQR